MLLKYIYFTKYLNMKVFLIFKFYIYNIYCHITRKENETCLYCSNIFIYFIFKQLYTWLWIDNAFLRETFPSSFCDTSLWTKQRFLCYGIYLFFNTANWTRNIQLFKMISIYIWLFNVTKDSNLLLSFVDIDNF